MERTWLGIGIGPGSIDERSGALILDLNQQRRGHLLSARLTTTFETFGEQWSDAGVLYGRGVGWRWGHASLSAGLSIAWGSRRGGEKGNTLASPGVPLEAEVYVAPFGVVGLRASAFADVNARRTFGGGTVGIAFGKLLR